jgi:tetratricopeptide (TPR) repeat protein
MRHETLRRVGVATVLGTLLLTTPGAAQQYREYYLRGRVLDTEEKPIPGVKIRLSDVATSRAYQMETDKKGVFKLAGLPHGVYEVTVTKEDYSSLKDKWDFSTPQDTMQRVELPDIVLASEAQAQEAHRLENAKAGVKAAAEALQAGDPDGAMKLLQGVLADSPDDTTALFFLGVSYSQKKMCPEAVEALNRVTDLSPTFAAAYFELGVCYRELDHLDKALEAYDKALELDPENVDSAYNSGLILFQTNKIEEALARFEGGLASKPEDPDLLEMAGRCYVHQAKLDVALTHLEKARAATTDPDKVAFLDDLIEQTKELIP